MNTKCAQKKIIRSNNRIVKKQQVLALQQLYVCCLLPVHIHLGYSFSYSYVARMCSITYGYCSGCYLDTLHPPSKKYMHHKHNTYPPSLLMCIIQLVSYLQLASRAINVTFFVIRGLLSFSNDNNSLFYKNLFHHPNPRIILVISNNTLHGGTDYHAFIFPIFH